MTIAVVGEVLVDLVWPTGTPYPTPHPGGSPANVAIGLHRLQRPVTLMSCWGDDPAGALIDSYLTAAGIRIHRLPCASRRSTIALAYLDTSTGSATYDFVTAWDPVEITVPADTTLLHTGSLAAVTEPGATLVVKACRSLRTDAGLAVSTDLNVRPAALPDRVAYRAQAERIVRESDIVKASDEDLLWLYPGQSPEESASLLHSMGPHLVVVTQGSRGAFAVTAGQQAAVPAPSVKVTDTIGAGDAFQAALLDALMRPDGTVEIPATHDELKAILLRSALAGALACTRAGAQPATRDELSQAGSVTRADRGCELGGDALGWTDR